MPGLCPWLFDSLAQLEHAAASGRLGHGWIFSGPRGIGKMNLAAVLAERILFSRTGAALPPQAEPQDILARLAELNELAGMHPDLHLIGPEEGKQTIAVDQIRAMIADLNLTALAGANKVVIIQHANRMTHEAANALLKSLEEPTPGTYLLLLAELPGRLPATVRSRCQQLTLRIPARNETLDWLESAGISVPQDLPGLSRMPPLQLAGLFVDKENSNQYSSLYKDIKVLSDGSADPHAIAEAWHKQDPEQALSCLIECLRSTIRYLLVPGHTNHITDEAELIMDNRQRIGSIDRLFASLRMAENLREQIGRGSNIELGLKALLLGLVVSNDKRLEV